MKYILLFIKVCDMAGIVNVIYRKLSNRTIQDVKLNGAI